MTSALSRPLIAVTGDAVFVTSSATDITHLDANGNLQGNFTVAPQNTHIDTLLAGENGNVMATYSGSSGTSGIVEFNPAGNERWRYEVTTQEKIQLALLATGNRLAVTSNGTDNVALVYLFDAQGNLIQQQNLAITAKRAQLINRNNGTFLLHNRTLTRLDNDGATLWSHTLPNVASCTAGDSGEAACWTYQMPFVFPPYTSPGYADITWLDAAGSVKHHHVFSESFSALNRIVDLHYNGNQRWTLEKFAIMPINLLSTTSPPKINHYTQFSVMNEQGITLKTITMAPAVYQDSGADRPLPGYITDGDEVTATIASPGKLYTAGTTRLTKKGFVSTYNVP